MPASRPHDRAPRRSTVRLFVFSGRPDPEFELPEEIAADLHQRLGHIPEDQRAEVIEAVPPPPPQLGYRGLLVRMGEGDVEQVLVYGGVISFRRGGRPHSWRDTTGIEPLLLEAAGRLGHQELLESLGVRLDPAPRAERLISSAVR
jgi:hypothetical protein